MRITAKVAITPLSVSGWLPVAFALTLCPVVFYHSGEEKAERAYFRDVFTFQRMMLSMTASQAFFCSHGVAAKGCMRRPGVA